MKDPKTWTLAWVIETDESNGIIGTKVRSWCLCLLVPLSSCGRLLLNPAFKTGGNFKAFNLRYFFLQNMFFRVSKGPIY